MVAVEFVAYDNHAAFVIVRDAGGYRWRCAREELYLLPIDSRQSEHRTAR